MCTFRHIEAPKMRVRWRSLPYPFAFYPQNLERTIQEKKTMLKEGERMARPRKSISKTEFEKLCALQCTEGEMCEWLGVCSDTLEKWCKCTYGANFSEVFAQKRGLGKISLRRAQFQLAQKSPAMAIFLGKQYLGQSDNPGANAGTTERGEDDPITAALKQEARNRGVQ